MLVLMAGVGAKPMDRATAGRAPSGAQPGCAAAAAAVNTAIRMAEMQRAADHSMAAGRCWPTRRPAAACCPDAVWRALGCLAALASVARFLLALAHAGPVRTP